MSDLHTVNEAVFNTLGEFPGVQYVMVVWDDDKSVVSSNQSDEGVALAKLLAAARMLANTDLAVIDASEAVGRVQ